ncbi:MAG: hypothetical protein AAB299_10425 [Thermodesulfobacteriota bacterium]
MSQGIYRIRKSFLVPLGVDVFLLCALFVISMLPQGSATERTVFAIFFVPSLYLFFESLLRRVTVDGGGIVLRKLLREKRISWEGITHVGGLSIHNKGYLLLTTVNGFFIISNAYGGFSDLVEEIVSRVDRTKVEEEVRLHAGRSPSGIVHAALAWTAAVFMVGIILIKILPFMA